MVMLGVAWLTSRWLGEQSRPSDHQVAFIAPMDVDAWRRARNSTDEWLTSRWSGASSRPRYHEAAFVALVGADAYRRARKLTDEGRQMIHSGNEQCGIGLMVEAVSIFPNYYSYGMLASEYDRLGQDDRALELYGEAAKILMPLAKEEAETWADPRERNSNVPVFTKALESIRKNCERLQNKKSGGAEGSHRNK